MLFVQKLIKTSEEALIGCLAHEAREVVLVVCYALGAWRGLIGNNLHAREKIATLRDIARDVTRSEGNRHRKEQYVTQYASHNLSI